MVARLAAISGVGTTAAASRVNSRAQFGGGDIERRTGKGRHGFLLRGRSGNASGAKATITKRLHREIAAERGYGTRLPGLSALKDKLSRLHWQMFLGD
jgi:hypothetical protein